MIVIRNYQNSFPKSFSPNLINISVCLCKSVAITPAMVNRNNIVIARREERTTKSKIPYRKSGQSPKGISINEIAPTACFGAGL